MEDYDVIVVGGGPAGATAARRVASGGARVLLLEKAAPGRDKPCGGGLTARAWRALDVDVRDVVRSVVTHADVRHGRARRAVIPLAADTLHMVLRCELDRLLLEAAASASAVIRTSEAAIGLDVDGARAVVRSERGSYRGSFLLIATGSEGRLREAAGLRAPKVEMVPAIEIESAATISIDPRTVILDYAIPRGYAWAFPKGDLWNVGVVSADPSVGQLLRTLLADFVDNIGMRFHSRDALSAVKGRRIPMWTGSSRLTSGRAALIGDAAGLADPFFGEGITAALITGRGAADAALGALGSGDAHLNGYERRMRRELHPHLRRMHMVARPSYAHPRAVVRILERSEMMRRAARQLAFAQA